MSIKEDTEATWGDRAPLVKLLVKGEARVWVDRDSDTERTYLADGWTEAVDAAADEPAKKGGKK